MNSTDRSRWEKAMMSFTMLKVKIAKTPNLKHFDRDRPPVIVVYSSKWAVSAALLQERDGTYWPVTFTSRTLKPNVIKYGMVEKEVLALLRILNFGYTMLVSREIKVLMRHPTLVWMVQSSCLNGRLGRWATLLSNWTLEIKKCEKEEDEIMGTLTASITPREEVEEMCIAIAPQKQPKHTISMPTPTVEKGESLWVVSFRWTGLNQTKGRGL